MDLSPLTGLMVGIMCTLSEVKHIPELAMGAEEGTRIQISFQNVVRHYPVYMSQLAIDWSALFGTLAYAAGGRFAAYKQRKLAERARDITPHPFVHPSSTAPSAAPGAPVNGTGAPANDRAGAMGGDTSPSVVEGPADEYD